MFVANASFEVFDHMRVPYRMTPPAGVDRRPFGELWADDEEGVPRLLWVRTRERRRRTDHRGVFEVAGCTVAGVISKQHPRELFGLDGVTWTERCPVRDAEGRVVAWVRVSEGGDVFLPFDPGAVMTGLWSESYLSLRTSARLRATARRAALRWYYRARPALPRRLQIRLRRSWASRTREPTFPRWPMESGLHDFVEQVLSWAGEVAGRPVPWIAPWPDGAEWCLVLTHDVETAEGCDAVELLRAPERERGYLSAWNFVPERYQTPTSTVEALRDEGCEIGVHGLRHDGHDLESRRTLERRRPGMLDAARAWGATGFRAPATQRAWDLVPALGFGHDSSYTDTDPYEPQPGGCCTWWPFLNRHVVEPPITLPQDHTLFAILGHTDGSLWVQKASAVRLRGGMVLALSHPDYADDVALGAWTALLDVFADDDTAWRALPREVAAWWRDRAVSHLEPHGDGWRIVGPAATRARVLHAGMPAVVGDREPA